MSTTTTALLPDRVHAAPVRRARHGGQLTIPSYWPILALFAGYPLWWALGLANIAVPVLGIVVIVKLLRRPSVRVPRGFGLWLLFFTWVLLSSTQLEEMSHYVAFTWRFLLWIGAIAVLVYVADTPREKLPDRVVLGALLALWAGTVIGGYLGLLMPSVRLWTPAQLLVPKSLSSIEFIKVTIAPRFAQVQDFLGYPLPRPAAPFTYTNSWGGNLALLSPVLFAAWPALPRRRRAFLGTLAVASLAPMILSVNRGLWITLIATSVYVAVRTAHRRDPRAARRLGALGLVLLALVAFTPMGTVVSGRLENDHSNNARATVAAQAREEVLKSPLLGFGSPRDNPLNPELPPIGTHGQIWMVLFCYGIPGALFFLAALVSLIVRTANPVNRRYLWLHGIVFGGMVMVPFYELLPMPLYIIAACAGLVLRDTAVARERAAAPA